MVAEITMVVILGLTTIIGTLFFNLRNIRKCRAGCCSCEQEIQQDKPEDKPPIPNPVEMVQQNMNRYARPTALWNQNLSIPETKIQRSTSSKSMSQLNLEEPTDRREL